MAKLTIPEYYLKGFQYFVSLDPSLREQLVREIKNSSVDSTPEIIFEKLPANLNLKETETKELIEMLFSLCATKERFHKNLPSFVDDIIDAGKQKNIKFPKSPETLKTQLVDLLNPESPFNTISKALSLSAERGKLLLGTRILTDVRPIFTGEEDNFSIGASLIIHNLKIEYNEGKQFKEVYFALAEEDLKNLKDDINRAENKAKLIKKEFESPSKPFIDI